MSINSLAAELLVLAQAIAGESTGSPRQVVERVKPLAKKAEVCVENILWNIHLLESWSQ